jgi:regulator of sigma E protease
MSILFYIFVAVVVIAVLFVIVVVHEWGHYKTAKLFGIRVDEFGFGYPPKIATLFKRGETTFTLNALPFGGFVKIYGEDAVEGGDVSRALFSKPKWQQAIVMVAGVVMNVLLAWVIFLFLFLSNSQSIAGIVDKSYVSNVAVTIQKVSTDSVAATAGFKDGDIVTSILLNNSEVQILKTSDFIDTIHSSKGEKVVLSINRAGVDMKIPVTPLQTTSKDFYAIGVSLDESGVVDIPFIKAVEYSITTTFGMIRDIFVGLYQLIATLFGTHTGPKAEVSGPVGIIKIIKDAITYGKDYVLYLTALISLNLAVLNILPIPALDGGRLLFIIIEKIIGRPINIKTATIIHTTSFFILVSLMLLVTFFDIAKLFR